MNAVTEIHTINPAFGVEVETFSFFACEKPIVPKIMDRNPSGIATIEQ
ncbi:hypothetical protein [Flavobacterium geliluteum]|uniref:Uncharacterized protein n=1 Tax=Flavobacterium geliluteum TaxID=2816120 RepID=A0A941AZ29_9FLAO|nr:hypothetical protein [Flavobacterium geliluteum]MBP4138477.1 hypothetical protein [Flavobacterium geliluteum]